jgi:hypothetical protein
MDKIAIFNKHLNIAAFNYNLAVKGYAKNPTFRNEEKINTAKSLLYDLRSIVTDFDLIVEIIYTDNTMYSEIEAIDIIKKEC